jgi:hypothetical protein
VLPYSDSDKDDSDTSKEDTPHSCQSSTMFSLHEILRNDSNAIEVFSISIRTVFQGYLNLLVLY